MPIFLRVNNKYYLNTAEEKRVNEASADYYLFTCYDNAGNVCNEFTKEILRTVTIYGSNEKIVAGHFPLLSQVKIIGGDMKGLLLASQLDDLRAAINRRHGGTTRIASTSVPLYALIFYEDEDLRMFPKVIMTRKINEASNLLFQQTFSVDNVAHHELQTVPPTVTKLSR